MSLPLQCLSLVSLLWCGDDLLRSPVWRPLGAREGGGVFYVQMGGERGGGQKWGLKRGMGERNIVNK